MSDEGERARMSDEEERARMSGEQERDRAAEPEHPDPPAPAPTGGLDPQAAIDRHRAAGAPRSPEGPGTGRGAGARQGSLSGAEPARAEPRPDADADAGGVGDAEGEATGDADRDADAAVRIGPPRLPTPVIDTRHYQFIIGGIGLAIVVAASIYLALNSHGGTPGIAAGQRLPRFVAPLADSNLVDTPANAHPVCNPARPARRGLNVCDRRPIVLAFFATGLGACVRQIDTLQTVSRSFPDVQFAAVAINASRDAARSMARRRHWTIPVAYDLGGTIAQLYGIEACPFIEVARADGIVTARLIGQAWESPRALSRVVARLGS